MVPALRKLREGRGTRGVGNTSEIKSLGHPPERRESLRAIFFDYVHQLREQSLSDDSAN